MSPGNRIKRTIFLNVLDEAKGDSGVIQGRCQVVSCAFRGFMKFQWIYRSLKEISRKSQELWGDPMGNQRGSRKSSRPPTLWSRAVSSARPFELIEMAFSAWELLFEGDSLPIQSTILPLLFYHAYLPVIPWDPLLSFFISHWASLMESTTLILPESFLSPVLNSLNIPFCSSLPTILLRPYNFLLEHFTIYITSYSIWHALLCHWTICTTKIYCFCNIVCIIKSSRTNLE